MSTKVEQPSTVNTSTASSSAKISMLPAKKGFVIPKNKLSGSLVPISRGGRKAGANDAVDEESNDQVQRKTRWGLDLTQDASVKKGRALAYQTRVDQVTEQLKSGFLDMEDNHESVQAAGDPKFESSIQKKMELLEVERREAIGEILKLNPSYKAPSDYKPLLKEAKVLVPVKEYPGYNFIGTIFGPSCDTQKRLEKETGAKVRVFGIKANTREKAEITSSDANEATGVYEELYVQISGDTYEKVDAAVALIELLAKPVLVNQTTVSAASTSVAGDVNIADESQGATTPSTIPAIGLNHVPQSITGSAQNPPQNQFQPYQGPGSWFSPGPPQALIHPSSGFIIPPNQLAPNPTTSSSPNVPLSFGPTSVLQRPFVSQGNFGPSQSPSRPVLPNPAPFNSHNQPSSTGFSPVAVPSGPLLSQSMTIAQMGPPIVPRPIVSGPVTFSNAPQPVSPFVPNQGVAPISAPRRIPSSSPMLQMQQVMLHSDTQKPNASTLPPPLQARTPGSFPVNSPSFTPIQSSPITSQKILHPNSDNFTFQPQQPLHLAPRGVHRPILPNIRDPLQNPPFRQHTSAPQSILQNISRPQTNQFRSHISSFPENSNPGPQVGPRNVFHVPPSSHAPHMGPRNVGIPFPPRPGNSLQTQHDFPFVNRPQNIFSPNIQLGGNISISIRPNSGLGAQQVYDPFSPTAVSSVPPQGGNLRNTRKQESDPEYEDLMASVGVK